MNSTKRYILIASLVLVPLGYANAALNSYLKLDGASGGSSATNTEAGSNANTGTIAPSSTTTPPGSSRDIYLDIKDIRGEAAEKAAENAEVIQNTGSNAERGSVQYNESDLEITRQNSVAVEAGEIRGWSDEEKSDFLKTVKTHAEMKSGQDLENFAKGILLRDENVESIEANEERVKISYKMPARFLGILTASLRTHAEVTYNKAVKVTLPWYSFLFKKLVAASDIESDMKANLPEVEDEVLVLFETRARMMTALSNVMKTKHDIAKKSINNLR